VDDDLYDEYDGANNSMAADGKEREAGKNLLGEFEDEIKKEEGKTEEQMSAAASNHRGRSMSMVQKHIKGLDAEKALISDLLPEEDDNDMPEGFDGLGDAEEPLE
jgi:hypothetical protein